MRRKSKMKIALEKCRRGLKDCDMLNWDEIEDLRKGNEMAKKKTVEKEDVKKTCDAIAVLAEVIKAIEKIECGSDQDRVIKSVATYFGVDLGD